MQMLKIPGIHDASLCGIEYVRSGLSIIFETSSGKRHKVLFRGDGYFHCDGFIGNNAIIEVIRYECEDIPAKLYTLARFHSQRSEGDVHMFHKHSFNPTACLIEIVSADILTLVAYFESGCSVDLDAGNDLHGANDEKWNPIPDSTAG